MHIAQVNFNDFTLRVHLGRLHFKTNQYNVPLFNYYLKNKQNIRIKNFFESAFSVFNNGLSGVNLTATSILIPPGFNVV
jgi:hypothetical protein